MNNKGFTIVELLIAMAILALLTVMAFPTLRSVQTANSNKKIESYGDSLVSAAKLYTDSYKEDMFKDAENDAIVLSFRELYEKNLIKDINLSGSSCKSSQVVVTKNGDNYIYCLNLRCDNNNEEVVIDSENTECSNYKSYQITYYGNYEENGIDLKERIFKDYKTKGEQYTLKKETNNLKPTGYRFAGWSKNKNVKTSFSPYESSFEMEAKEYNIYAKWCHECDNITNGTCTLKDPLTNNNTCTYTINCNTGYTKTGNNYNSKCEKTGYTLTYNSDGGSKCSPKTKTYKEKWGDLCVPTKNGYMFEGWKNGNTVITKDSIVEKDITVTAQWRKPYCIYTFDPNGGTVNYHKSEIGKEYICKTSNQELKKGYGIVSASQWDKWGTTKKEAANAKCPNDDGIKKDGSFFKSCKKGYIIERKIAYVVLENGKDTGLRIDQAKGEYCKDICGDIDNLNKDKKIVLQFNWIKQN